jgi:1,4-alpha-glucan branching enzyme
MPYVEGFGTWPFGEEWLLEAIAACYVPLVRLLERRAERGEQAQATIGVTPVLADQLALPGVGERFLGFMRGVRRECHRLDGAGLERDGQHGAAAALRESALDYERAADGFEELGGDLLGALARLRAGGAIELWASAATHPVLPMLATEQSLLLQADTGIAAHRSRLGAWSGGFWLPECAYRPGLEGPLAAAGVRCFCVDQTRAAADLDALEPAATRSGPVAVPIDWATIELAWGERGYPVDPAYRDYHRQTVNGMRPWANGGGPYDRDAAAARARDHARDFVARCAARMEAFRAERGRPGLMVFAVDTELLGHWWFEGVTWLDAVLDEAGAQGVALATLPDALERHEPVPRRLAESSWGAGKDLSTWDSPAVAGIVWPQRTAEVRLAAALARGCPAGARAHAERAARELMALQSSDWAFLETRRLAGDYALERAAGHAAAFDEALAAFERAVKDFAAVPPAVVPPESVQARVRGLAPGMSLAPLLGPASPWGRQALGAPTEGPRPAAAGPRPAGSGANAPAGVVA